MDFTAHNREARAVWEAFHSGKPVRMPMTLGINPRFYLLDSSLNAECISFQQYSENAEIMAEVQIRNAHYIRHHIYADHEMGLPENGWRVYVDLQNTYEAAWFGAEVVYRRGNSPFTEPLLTGERKNLLFERGIPDPFGGCYTQALRMCEQMQALAGKKEYFGRPIAEAGLPSYGTDGPMTVACNLRGTTQFCLDIYEDPAYAERLLDYITDATIARIRAWDRRFFGRDIRDSFGFADDSIQLLSRDVYRDLILPRHRRLVEALSNGTKKNSIHLCGDATRHFKTIRDELNVDSFDTGFPVRHGELAAELGPDVTISGGVHVDLLLGGTPQQVEAETRRIIGEVKPVTRRFIMREANNLAPCTPPENIAAMYEAVRQYGVY